MFGDSDPHEPSTRTAGLGTEAILRRFIDSLRNGSPNFVETPAFAQEILPLHAQLQIFGQRMGKIVAIEPRGSITETYDVFDVRHEHGTVRRRISIAPDGAIAHVSAILTASERTAGP